MTLATAKVATTTLLFLLNRLLNLRSIDLSLLRRWPLFQLVVELEIEQEASSLVASH